MTEFDKFTRPALHTHAHMKRGKSSKTAAAASKKRQKTAEPRPKSKRALEAEAKMRQVDWRDLSFIGAELASIDDIRKQPYKFPALEKELTEGVLSKLDHPVYMFLVSEPIYHEEKLVALPVIVVFDCEVAPPSLYAHDSVQSTESETRARNALGGRPIDMRNAHLAWGPYIPKSMEHEGLCRGAMVPIMALAWEGRTARTKKMHEEQVHYVEYINPYILLPKVCAGLTKPEVRNISCTWEYKGHNIDVVYDKDVDTVAEFQEDLIEKYHLDDDAKADIKAMLKEQFERARKDCDDQWDELQGSLAALSDKQKAAYEKAKLYKFYPSVVDFDITPYRVCSHKFHFAHFFSFSCFCVYFFLGWCSNSQTG